MPPTSEDMGFTLSGSAAATRHGTNRRSIQGPITTVLAARHRRRRPSLLARLLRLRYHSLALSELPPENARGGRGNRSRLLPAPKVWPVGSEGGCVHLSKKLRRSLRRVQLIFTIHESRAIGKIYTLPRLIWGFHARNL